MLTVVAWKWGAKYGDEYVARLSNALSRHLPEARLIVAAPVAEDEHLTNIPGCFARLRTFDPQWQAANGIAPGERIVVMDLDMVVTGSLSEIFDRAEPFVILQGVNAKNPCPYNGSVWMLRAGYRPDVSTDFSLERVRQVPFYIYPEDQGWFAHMLPYAASFGPKQGVYGFRKPGWPRCDALPSNARLVAFFGNRDPSQFTYLDWVRRNWQ